MTRWLIVFLICWYSVSQAQILDLSDVEAQQTVTDLNEDLRTQMQMLRLRIPDTPESIRIVELWDQQGREIEFRMLADPDLGYIIGTHRSDLTLELIKNAGNAIPPQFVVTGRVGEQMIDLSLDDLFVTDLSFGEYCLDLTKVTAGNVPLLVSVAVDVSGSMSNARSDINQSLRTFLERLPDEALCQIELFDHDQYFLTPQIPGSGTSAISVNLPPPASCSDFVSPAIEAAITNAGGGGTDIVGALRPLYSEVLTRKDAIHMVLVISDGAGSADRASPSFQDLVDIRDQASEEAGAYTVVNWLGNFATNYPLSDLADFSLAGPVNNQPFAQEFFQRAKQLLDGQSVITANSCS